MLVEEKSAEKKLNFNGTYDDESQTNIWKENSTCSWKPRGKLWIRSQNDLIWVAQESHCTQIAINEIEKNAIFYVLRGSN